MTEVLMSRNSYTALCHARDSLLRAVSAARAADLEGDAGTAVLFAIEQLQDALRTIDRIRTAARVAA